MNVRFDIPVSGIDSTRAPVVTDGYWITEEKFVDGAGTAYTDGDLDIAYTRQLTDTSGPQPAEKVREVRLACAVERDWSTVDGAPARSERGTFRDFTRYHGGMNAAYNRQDVVSPTFTNRLTAGIDQAYQDGAVLFYSLSATNTRGTTLRKSPGA